MALKDHVSPDSVSFPCLAIIAHNGLDENFEAQGAVYKMGFALRKLYTALTPGAQAEAHTLVTDAHKKWPLGPEAYHHLCELYKDVETTFNWNK